VNKSYPLLLTLSLVPLILGQALSPAAEPGASGQAQVKTSGPAGPDVANPDAAVRAGATEPDALTAAAGQKFSRGPSGEKKIVLTFDDGPHPSRTAQVVEILKREGIPANFFLVGEMVEEYPEQARLVVESGFEIGSHTWNHPNLTKRGEATVRKEIVGTQDLIEQVTGQRPRLFRPPGGSVNKTVRKVCKEDGLVLCMWSVDPRDWARNSTPESIRRKVLDGAHGGAIVCMHDTKAKTVTALPGIIKELRERGYEFTTISELIKAKAVEEARREESGGATVTADAGGADRVPSRPLTISLDESGNY